MVSIWNSVTQTEHFQGREFHRKGTKSAKSHQEINKMAVSKSPQHNGYSEMIWGVPSRTLCLRGENCSV